MKGSKIRCEQCRRWFKPVKKTQFTCHRKRCQRKRHQKNCEEWRKDNPGKGPAPNKVRNWAGPISYWQHYRRDHPEYREKEKQRMRVRRKSMKTVAKRDSRAVIYLGELRKIQSEMPETVATRDSRDRRVDALLMSLIRKESSQNETQAPALVI
jgi:hypothetical protein